MNRRFIFNQTQLEEAIGKQSYSYLVSDKVGVINCILERKELKKYRLHMFQCLSTQTDKLYNLKRNVTSGGLGVHHNRNIAIISCISEAIERYCMTYTPNNELIYEYWKNIDQKHRFNTFHTYSKEQYKNNSNFSDPLKEKIHWAKIYSLSNSKNYKYWPASLIYLPFEKSKSVSETSSTGMAAGFSMEECISSGMLELIERDALMLNFLWRLNPPQIDLETINIPILDKIKKEYKVELYKLYSDIDVPIYLSIIWTKKYGKYHYGIGASASYNSDDAINKALKECLFSYFYTKNIMDSKVEDKNKITALYEHFLYYQGRNFPELLFDSDIIPYKKETTNYDKVIQSLKQNQLDIYYKDLTTKDVSDSKLKVVKVIVPGLIDINKSHLLPRLGANRLFEVPKKLKLTCSDELSDMPHPFP